MWEWNASSNCTTASINHFRTVSSDFAAFKTNLFYSWTRSLTFPLDDQSEQWLGRLQGTSKVVVVVDRQQVIVLRIDVREQNQVVAGESVQIGHLLRELFEL